MGSICYYKSCLDTAVRLWEWKISARVCSHRCSNRKRDAWSEAPSELRCLWEHPGLEPAACSQKSALGQSGCWQPERSGSRHCSGKLAFTSQGCPPSSFGEEQKEKRKLEYSPCQREEAGWAGQWCALGFGREGQRERQGSTTEKTAQLGAKKYCCGSWC